jgi:nitrous oxide reductase accessory protein NosL
MGIIFRRDYIVGAILLTVLFQGPKVPAAAQVSKPKVPGERDKCPVCGMFVKDYPRWWAEILYKDGTVVFFDGCKDLFKYYLKPERFGGNSRKRIDAIYVKDYYNLNWIEARSAYFVVGSDVLGPMGRELVPLATYEDAKEFSSDHHGKSILRFPEIKWDLLLELSEGENM